jgi:hypothetical protein
MDSFDQLLEQIDAFIRKFYKNKMWKGLIFFVGVFLLSFLVTTTLEYFGRFNSGLRSVLFFSFIALNGYLCMAYFVVPLLRIYSFGKRINRYQAADIIGTFFPEVSDRLKNTLQLRHDLDSNTGNLELLRASVLQRSGELNVFSFGSAIDLTANKKRVLYLVPLFIVFVAIGIISPNYFVSSTERVVNFSQNFVPKAPFSFVLDKFDASIEEGEDVLVNLILRGDELPESVYIIGENGKFLMRKTGMHRFAAVVKKPVKSGSFYFEANEFVSDRFSYKVFGKARIGKMTASLVYPSYLGKENEVVENVGDLAVPEGTTITWSLATKNTKHVDILFNSRKESFKESGFSLTKKLKETSRLGVFLYNYFTPTIDSSWLTIDVIKDAYPTIHVLESLDSLRSGMRFFTGSVSDDYGLVNLSFVYTIISEDGNKRTNRMKVSSVSGVSDKFDFAVDFRREELKLRDKIEYYFVVSDNDGVNGSKATSSDKWSYVLPTLEELSEIRNAEQTKVIDDLAALNKRAQDFQKNMEQLKKDVLNAKKSDWNKSNKLNQLKEEQKSLLESLQESKELMNKSLEEKNQLSEVDKALLEKQEMIDKLLESLMDDELRSLLDQLQKLMDANDKKELKDKFEEIDRSSEEMNKQLDRSLEMLKRLQVNEKIDDVEKLLNDLAKQQEDLNEKWKNKELSKEDAAVKQKEINDKFQAIQKQLQELKSLNKELEKPMDLGDTQSDEEGIQEDLEGASDALDKGKDSKASDKQKAAAQGMKELSDKLNSKQEEANKKEEAEDINSLRSILESLVALSFDQEYVMLRFRKVNSSDPAYRRLGRKQRSIMDNTLSVRDSLLALARRQPKIASFVDKELKAIESNHRLAVEDVDEYRSRDLGVRQQSVMNAYNNLALLLNESLESMQSQMKDDSPGNGSCDKPGSKGKPKPGSGMSNQDMKQMLKKQLDQMEKGQNPGGKKPGDKPGDKPGGKSGEGGMGMPGMGNKEIAKMAAEQSAIRQRLEQLKNELNKEGKGEGNKLNPLLKELENQEKDLVRKKWNAEMITRQKNILTRLLESEKALMERGFEEKRESNSAKDVPLGNKIRMDEYIKQKRGQVDVFRSVDPLYRKYYKDKAYEYFNEGL